MAVVCSVLARAIARLSVSRRLVAVVTVFTPWTCSSVAAPIVLIAPSSASTPSRICWRPPLASSLVCAPSSARRRPSAFAATASRAAVCRPRTIFATSVAAAAARSASARTSSAITAKPRPCSPARAASMLAFSDRRFVRSAIRLMVWTMSPISSARLPMSFITTAPCTIASRIFPRPVIVRATV